MDGIQNPVTFFSVRPCKNDSFSCTLGSEITTNVKPVFCCQNAQRSKRFCHWGKASLIVRFPLMMQMLTSVWTTGAGAPSSAPTHQAASPVPVAPGLCCKLMVHPAQVLSLLQTEVAKLHHWWAGKQQQNLQKPSLCYIQNVPKPLMQ